MRCHKVTKNLANQRHRGMLNEGCPTGCHGLRAMMKSKLGVTVPAPEPEATLGLQRAPNTVKFKLPPAVWGVVAAAQVADACSTSLAVSAWLICMAY